MTRKQTRRGTNPAGHRRRFQTGPLGVHRHHQVGGARNALGRIEAANAEKPVNDYRRRCRLRCPRRCPRPILRHSIRQQPILRRRHSIRHLSRH
jgi:hypothetical protein